MFVGFKGTIYGRHKGFDIGEVEIGVAEQRLRVVQVFGATGDEFRDE